jgi:hypothetical protein
MLLNVLVPNTRDDAFVAINKPQNLEVFPYSGVHIRVPFGSYSCSSSGSVSGRASKQAQSSLKATVKDGGRAEKRRVWKLRVYKENTVAPSLGKAGQKRSLKQCGPTHSSGGAHALYHSIEHEIRFFSSSGNLLTLCEFQQTKVTAMMKRHTSKRAIYHFQSDKSSSPYCSAFERKYPRNFPVT